MINVKHEQGSDKIHTLWNQLILLVLKEEKNNISLINLCVQCTLIAHINNYHGINFLNIYLHHFINKPHIFIVFNQKFLVHES